MKSLLIGRPEYLRMAYPESLRSEIRRYTDLNPVEITSENWNDHPEVLAQTDVILSSWGMPVMGVDFLRAAPRLKAVFYGAGSVKGFVTPEVYARGIFVSSSWEANAVPVAEYALASIILGLKGFWRSIRLRSEGRFEHSKYDAAGAYQSTVGLVSLGASGRRVVDLLRNLDVRVIAFDPFIDPDVAEELGVTLVSLQELFECGDVVSLHTPWLPETEGMVSGELIQSMKPGSALINTARGALIRENELCKVLEMRKDLTAILDVTHPEPCLPESPLWRLSNVIMTPHIAGSVGGEIERMGKWMVEEMKRFSRGEPLHHEITEMMLASLA